MSDRRIHDGDVFRWRFKDEHPGDRAMYSRYHCMSQIAVARKGFLIDTFWGDGGGQQWAIEIAREKLDLTPLGNLADFDKAEEYKGAYFDDGDCMNLNHSNSSRGNFYIRKGAKRSRAKMVAIATERLAAAEREESTAKRQVERYRGILSDLMGNAPLDGVYL